MYRSVGKYISFRIVGVGMHRRRYFVPAPKISRSPLLYSKSEPAESCGIDSYKEILAHWNRTGPRPSHEPGVPVVRFLNLQE